MIVFSVPRRCSLRGAQRHRALRVESLEPRQLLVGAPLIAEFQAINNSTLIDEDGDFSDWIEIRNPQVQPVSLAGWHLTDDLRDLTKWQFPADVTIDGHDQLLVFASGKNRVAGPQAQLHTNFRLSGNGESLALVRPDGVSIVQSYAPYPAQVANQSYGLGGDRKTVPLVEPLSTVKTFVPTDNSLGASWQQLEFDDSAWQVGALGVGYEVLASGFTDAPDLGQPLGSEWTIDLPAGTSSTVKQQDGALRLHALNGDDLTFDQRGKAPMVYRTVPDIPSDAAPWEMIVQINQSDGGRGRVGLVIVNEEGLPAIQLEYSARRFFRLYAEGNRIGTNLSVRDADSYYLRLKRTGSAWSGFYKLNDDDSWREVGVVVDGDDDRAPIANPRVGVYARRGSGLRTEMNASIQQFKLIVDNEPASYKPFIHTDVAEMNGVNSSVYLRIPFQLDRNPAVLDELSLTTNIDDGLVAYLNGIPLTTHGDEPLQVNAPLAPDWNSTATAEISSMDPKIRQWRFNIASSIDGLQEGENLLAIHGLNIGLEDKDFFFDAKLTGIDVVKNSPQFFVTPTPGASNERPARLLISEFVAANSTGLIDEDGQTSDWLEIHNPTTAAVQLEGWSLTDDEDQLHKWTFPRLEIAPGGFQIVFASQKNRAAEGSELHTNFQLDSRGEYLALVRPDGTVESEYGPTFPGQIADASFGQVSDNLTGRIFPGLRRHFTKPTPGTLNGSVLADLAPVISELSRTDGAIAATDSIQVTARVTRTFGAVTDVRLWYRTMFGQEKSVAMYDDGFHNDGLTGDGLFGATIPGEVANPGEMLRYRVTADDVNGNTTRWPLFNDATRTPEYYGTIVEGPNDAQLPVLHWFTETVAASQSIHGARASVFFLGEFYDNVFVRGRGAGGTGAGQKFEFNRGFDFRYADDVPRVREINTRTTAGELNEMVSLKLYRDAGTPAPQAFPVSFRRNGIPSGIDTLIEHVDQSLLVRNDLDEDGALFKMYNSLTDPHRRSYSFYRSDNSKRNREWDLSWDLDELVEGIHEHNPQRTIFLMDNVNIPAMINYLAATVLTGDYDHETHNYFAYRDNDGTGEWQYVPWDRNSGFQIAFQDPTAHPFLGSSEYVHPPWACLERGCNEQWNRLTDAIYDTPATREMFLRRLRTLMDQFLQSPETPIADRKLETYLDELAALLDKEVDGQVLSRAATGLKRFVDLRRTHLYVTHGIDNAPHRDDVAGIPHAQQGNPEIQFGQIEVNPVSGNQNEEFLELFNPLSTAVDISGWQLTGGVTFQFRPGTVIPAGDRLFVSPNPVAFRARSSGPSGGQTLFVQGGYTGYLSNHGATVNLVAADGQLVSSVTTPAEPTPAQKFLRISEIHYHPADDREATEFLELHNISSGNEAITLDLTGVTITDGPSEPFTVTAGTQLESGEYLLVVRDVSAFQNAYPEIPPMQIMGPFAGSLSNGGERIKLDDAHGSTIQQFTYGDTGLWPQRADGVGASLELIDPARTPVDRLDKFYHWRASTAFGGSPGNHGEASIGLVINELLATPDGTTTRFDSIELFNETAASIDASGWFLSDSATDLLKYQILAETVVMPGEYLLLDERDFNPSHGLPVGSGFAINGTSGDDLWLVIPDKSGNVVMFVDDVHFGASAAGESLGRNSFVSQLTPLIQPTLGTPNASARIGPLVISEVNYHPGGPSAAALALDPNLSANDLEYVEINNPTSASVDLEQWRLRGGVDYDFAADASLKSGESLLLLSFDPTRAANAASLAAFREHYDIGTDVILVGGYQGRLNNGGDLIQLQRPGALRDDVIPRLWEDEVLYDDLAPWPLEANGQGNTLQRRTSHRIGYDAAAWISAAPSPGSVTLHEPHQIGDSNHDGVFDSADLTFVLAAGKYNDGIPHNATFEEGDWNQDGDFDELDIVYAFTAGHYVVDGGPATSALAAAIDAAHADDDGL